MTEDHNQSNSDDGTPDSTGSEDSTQDSSIHGDPIEHRKFITDTERQRGILTKNDREFLLNPGSLEGQDKRNTRYRIRQRLIHAILDLHFIELYMGGEDLRQVASSDEILHTEDIPKVVSVAYRLLSYHPNISDPMSTFEDHVAVGVKSTVLDEQEPPDEGYGPLDIVTETLSADAEINVEKQEATIDELVTFLKLELSRDSTPDFEDIDKEINTREDILDVITELKREEDPN